MKSKYKKLIVGAASIAMFGLMWPSTNKEVTSFVAGKTEPTHKNSPAAIEHVVSGDEQPSFSADQNFSEAVSSAPDGLAAAYAVCQKAFSDPDGWNGEISGGKLFVDYNDRQTGYQIKASIVSMDDEASELDITKIEVFNDSGELILETYKNKMMGYSATIYPNKYGDMESHISARPFQIGDEDKNLPFTSFTATGPDRNFESENFWKSEETREEAEAQKKIGFIQNAFCEISKKLFGSPHTKTLGDDARNEQNIPAGIESAVSALQNSINGKIELKLAGRPGAEYNIAVKPQDHRP